MFTAANATCEYGLRPYISADINALNPCFISYVSVIFAGFFIAIGSVQYVMLRAKRNGPVNFKFDSFWTFRHMSVSHMIHISNVLFHCALLLVQLSWVQDEPSYTKWNIGLNLFYVGIIYFGSTWLAYYKSSCAQGHGIFYFIIYSFLIGYQIGQRLGHPDSGDKFNVVKHGEAGLLVDILLFFNSLSIFCYDTFLFQYSPQLANYFSDNNIYPPVNILASISFTWMNELIMNTYRANKIEDPSNMPLPPYDLEIASATDRVKANWEYEQWTNRNSLFMALLKTFGPTIGIAICYEVGRNILSIIQPQFLKLFIEAFDPTERSLPILNGFFVAIGLFLLNVMSTIISNQFFINIFEAGLKIRGSLMSMVYQKSLRLSLEARDNKESGDVMNLMSVDVIRIQRFFENGQILVGAPIQLVGVLISLYFLLGAATMGGLVSLVVMIPINSYLTRLYKDLFQTQMRFKDKRIKTVTEILNSMKSIKLYAWETPMYDRLSHVRNDLELGNMKKIAIVSNFMYFCWNFIPLLVTCSTFVLFNYFRGEVLSPQIVFPALTLFSMLNDCLFTVPNMISNVIEIGVSMKRLGSYLLAEELDTSFLEISKPNDTDPTVEISNATFLWKSPKNLTTSEDNDEEAEVSSPGVALKSIEHFSADQAKLTCIVGRVGSGKSTFLQAILGQLPCVSNDETLAIKPKVVIRAESIAYCPQQPWIMNASLKENILFGYRYNEDLYQKTIKACQLIPDLEILPDGDETIVGEKGISLSGGQKARLSLARAVYSKADLYLLDDVLSAVDSHVCKNIIDEVLDRKSGLLKKKAVILTTNAVNVLAHSDMIYLLKNGKITEKSSYERVMSDIANQGESVSSLRELIEEFASKETNDEDTASDVTESEAKQPETSFEPTENLLDFETSSGFSPAIAYEEDRASRDLKSLTSRRASIATLKPRPLIDLNKDDRKTAQKAENKEEGRVKGSVYMAYIKACGVLGVLIVFVMMALMKLLDLAKSFWLKHWSEDNLSNGSNERIWWYVAIYALIGTGSAVFELIRLIVMMLYCSLRASKVFHNEMARSVIFAPMSFFETTPVGRIVNRFSSDINSIDEDFQHVVSFFFRSIFDYVITFIIIAVNMPLFLVFNTILLVIYYYYQLLYIVLCRELKRLTSVSYSPVMSLMSETLSGHVVINAYKHANIFKYYNFQNVQTNINFIFNFRSTNRWLTMRLQSIGAVIVLMTSLMALATLRTANPISAGLIGLLMSYALQVSTTLVWIVRMAVNIETTIVSVERIIEYRDLKPEGVRIVEDNRPPEEWPSRGDIQFMNYTTKYRENLDPVLKNVSVSIKHQEKIGVVGRTGAGKSTLTLALFRLLEPYEGSIVIDGVDISKIGLFDLRSKLSIIPQDAQAFEGTVRSNMDPFNRHTDVEIWRALELSHLKPHVERIVEEMGDDEEKPTDLLQTKISDNGSNLSMGQRQLLCLSRALLNPSKILILDEATAAVDRETDRIIQETIRTAFRDRTILTIAHRIDTVLDSDKILVLDRGEVKEFDTPEKLLQDKDSIFYNLCDKGGYLKEEKKSE